MKNLPVTRKVFILSEIPVCKGESVSTELSKMKNLFMKEMPCLQDEKLAYDGNRSIKRKTCLWNVSERKGVFVKWKTIIGGSCHKYDFCRAKHVFCRDKIMIGVERIRAFPNS